jgi:hypothetical protein
VKLVLPEPCSLYRERPQTGDRQATMSCSRMYDIEYSDCMLEDDILSTFKSNENVHSYHIHIGEEMRRRASRVAQWN